MYKNYEILSSCDFGIIPLSKKNKMAWHKPANKLISFWFAGLPTLASDTPAYVELMKNADTNFYCYNTDDWISKIKEFYSLSAEERELVAKKNLDYAKKNFSNESLDNVWFEIFKIMNIEI